MKAYPEYKASGIDWLGEIPSHWEMSKYKYHADSRMGITILKEQMVEDGLPIYSATQDDTILGYTNNRSLLLHSGDFVIPARGNSIGYVSKVSFDEATCSQTTICSTNFRNICTDYLLFCCKGFKKDWFFFVDTAIPQITVSQVDNNILPLPPVAEQEAIAAYLDDVTGKIDALISEKRKQVEDIRAYRTSLITETVTRGLNPDAPLRPSGIDWLGDIPEHWKIVRLGWLANVQTGTTPSTSIDEYWNEPAKNWFTPGDFVQFEIKGSKRKVSEFAFNDNACRVFPPYTVYMVGIGATLGKVAFCKESASANQQINAILFNNEIYPVFGAYYLLSIADIIKSKANFATLPILNQEQTKQLYFEVPPLTEQQAIADFLDAKTAKIDELIGELTKQIDELTEYKQAVITEAVTGKVDVRDYKPSN